MVGIALLGDEVVQDDVSRATRAVLSPAFAADHPDSALFGRLHLHLRDGAEDVPTVQAEIQRAFARGDPAEDGAATFEVASVLAEKVQRGVRPQVGALAAFAALAGLVSVLVVGQALSRATSPSSPPTSRRSGRWAWPHASSWPSACSTARWSRSAAPRWPHWSRSPSHRWDRSGRSGGPSLIRGWPSIAPPSSSGSWSSPRSWPREPA